MRVTSTLSGRFLILTTIFVMLAEILIFLPSVARFRQDYLLARLERAQIASLALLADDMISPELESELLQNAEVFNVVLRRDEMRELVLSSPIPQPVYATFDMRDPGAWVLIKDAVIRLLDREERIIRVIGNPVRDGGLLIEITTETAPLRKAMLDYGLRVLALSAVISILTAVLLFLSVRVLLVKPIKGVVSNMQRYADAPQDARSQIVPQSNVVELREAEEALLSLQTQLTNALRQKDRLAQLGAGVSKISHDLRNILTSAQLFSDRLDRSQDPTVQRLAPKLVNSITRAVNLCETTLAFGRVEEPAPRLARVSLTEIVDDVLDGERLAAGDADISFSQDIPVSLQMRADPEQLYRVIGNLVRNARQAISASSRDGEISVQAIETEAEWIVTVADTGPGLPPRAQDHLFEAFQGGVRRGGSGLGLAIAAELIAGHGGRIALDYTGEDGTQFSIHLPKADAVSDAVFDDISERV